MARFNITHRTLILIWLQLLLNSVLSTFAMSTAQNAGKTVINHLIRRSRNSISGGSSGIPLTQTYYALRHGQSLANVAKIISSDPKISTVEHGLSDVGKDQARAAGEAFAKEYLTHSSKFQGVAIFSSDFTRARETASIFGEALSGSDIPLFNGGVVLETRLRERFFGDLNGGPDTRYQDVWDVDCLNADHNEFNVESANSVLQRTTKLVEEIDQKLNEELQSAEGGEGCWKCVLVAHGDVLQILQTGFLKHEDASRHRSLTHLETATIRELILPN